jgi:ABC-type antimicrobial peptide transport system permease subunit
MLQHYLKIAFRNIRKYKMQNFISIAGLAVGFVCFAFSALWIRYEMNYDDFHPKADRIYRVHTDFFKWNTYKSETAMIRNENPYPLASYLKSNFPEIENACGITFDSSGKFQFLYADSSFCNIFDMNMPEELFVGGTDRPVAVTSEFKGISEFIKKEFNYDALLIFPRWPSNTNIPFNVFVPVALRFTEKQLNSWGRSVFDTYILVRAGTDVQVLEKKLDKITIPEWNTPVSVILTPLKQIRYINPSGETQSDIKFSHIRIFTIAGLLVILSSLFNHLTLYVTRVRMRLRELALHKVNGATNGQIAATLYTDFLLIILLSLIVSFILMTFLLPAFKEYASIGNNNFKIYAELLCYAALLIVCSFVAGGIPVFYFQKQTLAESVKGYSNPKSKNLFFRATLLVQLIISLGLIFCSVVFIKQIRFLNHTDLGINRHNIAAVSTECCELTPPYTEQIKQVNGIIDAIPIERNDFLRNMSSNSSTTTQEKDGETISYTLFFIYADAHFFDFFEIKFIEGTGFLNEFDSSYPSVYNETAMKETGDILKTKNFKGVVQDFYLTPTTKAKPTQIYYPNPKYNSFRAIAYKYEENLRLQTQEAVTQWLYKEFPNNGKFNIHFTYMEDIFNEYFKSERALLVLLSVMTGACVAIAIFGVYSLTSLSCQQRRKEIAIRKINGAEVLDIMNIFFKEYLLLLAFAALLAFPAGYIIMKEWLQNYVKQTSIDAQLFVMIFLAVFLIIAFSILSMIWKASTQNPVEVINTE